MTWKEGYKDTTTSLQICLVLFFFLLHARVVFWIWKVSKLISADICGHEAYMYLCNNHIKTWSGSVRPPFSMRRGHIVEYFFRNFDHFRQVFTFWYKKRKRRNKLLKIYVNQGQISKHRWINTAMFFWKFLDRVNARTLAQRWIRVRSQLTLD